jgi:hypothetical protein
MLPAGLAFGSNASRLLDHVRLPQRNILPAWHVLAVVRKISQLLISLLGTRNSKS